MVWCHEGLLMVLGRTTGGGRKDYNWWCYDGLLVVIGRTIIGGDRLGYL